MSLTYLTTDELAERIKYNPRTIRNVLKDSVLFEGRHYIRPFGGRKILFIWEHIEKDMFGAENEACLMIPMINGGSAMAKVNARNGKLYMDFRFQGIRCREQTAIEDTLQR